MVKVTLDVTAASEEVLDKYCSDYLTSRGWNCSPPNEKWETPQEFNKRLGVSKECISRAINRVGCPHVEIHTDGRGIASICSNAAFDAFCLRHKK